MRRSIRWFGPRSRCTLRAPGVAESTGRGLLTPATSLWPRGRPRHVPPGSGETGRRLAPAEERRTIPTGRKGCRPGPPHGERGGHPAGPRGAWGPSERLEGGLLLLDDLEEL